jgi:hypothetical protein
MYVTLDIAGIDIFIFIHDQTLQSLTLTKNICNTFWDKGSNKINQL